tara:strand:- start:687 stop:944 length:258 start_codon:yes stop_codon:yes gene_type:complete
LLLLLSLGKEEEKRVELERRTLRPAMAIIVLSLSLSLSLTLGKEVKISSFRICVSFFIRVSSLLFSILSMDNFLRKRKEKTKKKR